MIANLSLKKGYSEKYIYTYQLTYFESNTFKTRIHYNKNVELCKLFEELQNNVCDCTADQIKEKMILKNDISRNRLVFDHEKLLNTFVFS